MAELQNGSVKWFNDEKGYGFIQQEDGGADLFVHFRQVNNSGYGRVSLTDGQKVLSKSAKVKKALKLKTLHLFSR